MSNHYTHSTAYQQDVPPYMTSTQPPVFDQHRPQLRPALTDLNDFADESYGQPVNRMGNGNAGELPPGYLNYDRPPYDGPTSPITPGIPISHGPSTGTQASLGRRNLPVPPRDTAGNRSSSMTGRRPLPAPPGASSPVAPNDWDFGPPPQSGNNVDHRSMPNRQGESMIHADVKRASTASRRPLPANPEATHVARPLPPPIPSPNPSYLSSSTAASTPLPLPSPSPYPIGYTGTPSFPGFSLPNPVYGSPVGVNGFMYPAGSLPPPPPPFVPPGGFLPSYMPPPTFPGMPPGYPVLPPPTAAFQPDQKGRNFAELSSERRDDDLGDGGQATPRATDRRDQPDYFAAPPKGSEQEQSDGQPRQGRSFGQEYLASLSVSDEPEDYSPSIVDSYHRRQGSEAHLMSSDSLNSTQSTDDTPASGGPEQRNFDYPYGPGPGDGTHRESVVSLPQSVRTFGEGPSNPQDALQHRRTYSRDPQLQHRGSLAPSWLEQNQEGRPPARWVQNKLFLHQSHAAGFSPTSMGDVTGEDGQVDGYFDEEFEEEYDEEEAEEQNEMNFFSPSLLSHVSVQLRDRVERNSHIKGGIPWPKSFTGRDIVVSTEPNLLLYVQWLNLVYLQRLQFILSCRSTLERQAMIGALP